MIHSFNSICFTSYKDKIQSGEFECFLNFIAKIFQTFKKKKSFLILAIKTKVCPLFLCKVPHFSCLGANVFFNQLPSHFLLSTSGSGYVDLKIYVTCSGESQTPPSEGETNSNLNKTTEETHNMSPDCSCVLMQVSGRDGNLCCLESATLDTVFLAKNPQSVLPRVSTSVSLLSVRPGLPSVLSRNTMFCT